MNKQLLNLIALALLIGVHAQAQSTFQYTATAKVEAFDKVENLTGAEAVVSHEFDADTGQGTVMYEGDVTKIVPSAFWHTEALTTITIPEGVQTIDSHAFDECFSLTTVHLPNSLTYVGAWLFEDCTSLTSVNIPTSLPTLSSFMFHRCTGLTDIDIPDNVTLIESCAFEGCTGLTSIYIPASVTKIRTAAFAGCTNLTKVITPSITAWCNIMFVWEEGSHINYPGANPLYFAKHLYVGDKVNHQEVTDVVVPKGVTEIHAYAFYNSTVKSVSLPSTVTSIGTEAFRGCTELTTLKFANGLQKIGYRAFIDCPFATLTLPASINNIEYSAFEGLAQLADIYCYTKTDNLNWRGYDNAEEFMPDKQTKLHVGAGDVEAWQTKFPNANLTIMGDMTSTFRYTAKEKVPRFDEFQYFTGATGVVSHDFDAEKGEGTVVYEGAVYALGSNALLFTYSLTGIDIPEGVTEIGFQAFKGCTELTNITLPKSLTVIEGMAFDACSDLKDGQFIIDDIAWWCSVDINSNPLYYAKHIYSAKDQEITDLVIPEGVTCIGDNAFYHVEGIKSVTFPENAVSIGSAAFYSTGLETVTIPKGVTEIGGAAFERCGNLKTVTIPEGVTKIGSSAFAYSGLTELTLPSTIREMSQSFYGCENLAKLNLTDGITTLGSSFYSCPTLKEVHIPGSVKSIGYSDFSRCTNLETVTIGEGTEEIQFQDCEKLSSITIPSTAKSVLGFRNCKSLTSVTCLAMEPPSTYREYTIPYGSGITMEGRTLYVPALALNAYKETNIWKEFPNIEPLDVMPANILVRDEVHLTLPAEMLEGKPNVKLLHENDPKYGILRVDGEGSLKMSSFSLHVDPYMQYKQGDRMLNHSSLINTAQMEADNVSVELWIYSKIWTFASLPFDWKVGDVEPFADGTTDWVIYTYDGKKRADGQMTETWVKMKPHNVVKAGQGFIVQGQRTGADNKTKYDVALRFKALDNDTRNLMFKNTDVTMPLKSYDSEFMHNRSWNFVGNPYPSYYDTEYMDFRAPITVWNMSSKKYEAMRPGDDKYILCPGEGFFVQCPEDKEAILFNQSGRQTTHEVRAAAARTRSEEASRAVFNIVLKNGSNTDRTRIVINEEASAQYELDKDAGKFFSTETSMPLIYTTADGENYAINERPLGDGIVNLCVTDCSGSYCTITLAEDIADYEVTIEDPETGKTEELKDGNAFPIYAKGQSFLLHIKNTSTSIKNIQKDSFGANTLYNLNGQRVDKTYKGVVIQNGKKVMK
jgi:hypothetical protein